MIFPPHYKRYEWNGRCVSDYNNNIPCSHFQCGSCTRAWDAYTKELKDEYRDYVLPTKERIDNGITYFINPADTISKFENLNDLYRRHPNASTLPFMEYNASLMNQDELKKVYPFWYALKTLKELGEPVLYRGGSKLPLIVGYLDCVYVIAPIIECE